MFGLAGCWALVLLNAWPIAMPMFLLVSSSSSEGGGRSHSLKSCHLSFVQGGGEGYSYSFDT